MRIALIVVLGFCAVFAWTLVVARGHDGPPLSSTRFCGTWRPTGPAPAKHVVYATRMDCPRAIQLAQAYNQAHRCPYSSASCLAHVQGFKCFTKGTAGPRLIWIGCERPKGVPPRSIFSVDRV